MKIFNTQSIQLLKKSLDVYARQHEGIAKNIANANKEGYTRTQTDFDKLLRQDLQRTLKTTNPKHISESKIPEGRNHSENKEKVDLSREMGALSENQIRYDFAARTLAKAYRGLNLSIIGRNR